LTPGATVDDDPTENQRREGQEYNFDSPIWRNSGSDQHTTSCKIDGLIENVTCYFVVRTCSGPLESGNSNEVSYRPSSNRTPVARTGGNQHVTPDSQVILDGTGSCDQDGDGSTYHYPMMLNLPGAPVAAAV
jgi:hypothetical protein